MYVKQTCKLVDFMTTYIKKKVSLLIFFQKSSRPQNVTKKSCKFGFPKQCHSLKFQKVGKYKKINASDHMEFCLVINMTFGGNWAVTITWPPIIATRCVSFATSLNTKNLASTNYPQRKLISNTGVCNVCSELSVQIL